MKAEIRALTVYVLIIGAVACAGVIRQGAAATSKTAALLTKTAIEDAGRLKCAQIVVPGCATQEQMNQLSDALTALSKAGAKYDADTVAANGAVVPTLDAFTALVDAFNTCIKQIGVILGPNAKQVVGDLRAGLRAL